MREIGINMSTAVSRGERMYLLCYHSPHASLTTVSPGYAVQRSAVSPSSPPAHGAIYSFAREAQRRRRGCSTS